MNTATLSDKERSDKFDALIEEAMALYAEPSSSPADHAAGVPVPEVPESNSPQIRGS